MKKAQKQQQGSDRLLTVAEVAAKTGMERWQIYDVIAKGHGPRVMRLGRRVRVPERAFQEWMDGRDGQE